MMWHDLLVAVALMLVLEGLLPLLNPKNFKQAMYSASQMSEQEVRWVGLVSMVAGAVMIYFLKH
jgi:uncharacterized protein YjeT (DUF2065 family)